MKLKSLNIICILFLFGQLCYGQDTLRIKETLNIKKNQEFTVKAGTVIIFAPETRIWVEGGLKLLGSIENPIQLISENTSNPGIGISISGANNKSSIVLENIKISGLVQAIRFEPFWYRKNVQIKLLSISSCLFSESCIYVSAPILDQRNKGIHFSLTKSSFYNNSSGVILEEFGNRNLIYQLSELSFFENRLNGSDISLGVLHLDLSASLQQSNYKIESLLFNRNLVEDNEIGLSISGIADSVFAGTIYKNESKRPVFDYFYDPRLPKVVFNDGNLTEWPEKLCLVQSIHHEPGKIELKHLNCEVLSLLDSNHLFIPSELIKTSEGTILKYPYKANANFIKMSNGVLIGIPLINQNLILQKDSLERIENQQYEDSILVAKAEIFKPTFEFGVWGGLSAFLGDVKHKFGIPGCMEWTGGTYLQYNYRRNFSIRASYYRTNIGMHDPTAPLFMFQSAPVYINDVNGSLTELSSWETSFRTKINSLEFQGIWYLGNKTYSKEENAKGKFITGISFGVGIMHYNPFRGVVYSRYKDSAVFVEARPLGLEGQNFLPNKSKYGSIAINFSTGLDLNFIYKKWKFKSEIRFIITGTDYLDDMGTGYMYGGNYDEWLRSNQDWVGPINKFTGRPVKLEEVFSRKNASSSRRTTDLLPDGYFQLHFGCSYEIDDLFLSLKRKKTSN